jgi:hypothetical protein
MLISNTHTTTHTPPPPLTPNLSLPETHTSTHLQLSPPVALSSSCFQAEYACRSFGGSLESAMEFLLAQDDGWQPPPADEPRDGSGSEDADGGHETEEQESEEARLCVWGATY